jgi:hypothetical protein
VRGGLGGASRRDLVGALRLELVAEGDKAPAVFLPAALEPLSAAAAVFQVRGERHHRRQQREEEHHREPRGEVEDDAEDERGERSRERETAALGRVRRRRKRPDRRLEGTPDSRRAIEGDTAVPFGCRVFGLGRRGGDDQQAPARAHDRSRRERLCPSPLERSTFDERPVSRAQIRDAHAAVADRQLEMAGGQARVVQDDVRADIAADDVCAL